MSTYFAIEKTKTLFVFYSFKLHLSPRKDILDVFQVYLQSSNWSNATPCWKWSKSFGIKKNYNKYTDEKNIAGRL